MIKPESFHQFYTKYHFENQSLHSPELGAKKGINITSSFRAKYVENPIIKCGTKTKTVFSHPITLPVCRYETKNIAESA